MLNVKNLINAKGNTVKNQFVITESINGLIEKIIFQSYNSIICIIEPTKHKITFGIDFDYSVTTMKHLNKFLSDYPITANIHGVKDIREIINNGGYTINNIDVLAVYDSNLK